MEKKELLTRLIEHYEYCIAGVRKHKDINDIKQYLVYNYVMLGICHCASMVFDRGIYGAPWVKQHWSGDATLAGYWYKTPLMYNTKQHIIKALQVRVDIMKQELSKEQ